MMSLFSISKYNQSGITFPDQDIPLSEKNESWFLRNSEAIYSMYLRDRAGLPYSKRNEMDLLRLFGEGNQPVEKYQDLLCPADPQTHERKGYMNISWDIESIAPKFKALVLGMFQKIEHDVVASGIDDNAIDEKTELKWKTWTEKKLEPFFSEFPEEFNMKASPEEFPILPESLQELDMLEEIGAFKLKEEMGMEMLINASFYESQWEEETKTMIYEDLFEVGVAACKDEVNKHTQKVIARYVDPKNVIVQYSRSKTFNNISKIGEVRYMRLADLRQDASGWLTEKQLKDVAENYLGYSENPNTYEFDYYSNEAANGGFGYDDFTVIVLDVEWYGWEKETYKTGKSKRGIKQFFKQKHGYRPENKEKEALNTEVKTVYKAKWIIGTNYIYDWGKQTDIPREQPRDANFSYHVYKYSNKSMLSQIVPNLNEMQIAVLNLRNAMSKAAPSGIAIEYGTLQNMNIGSKRMKPLDILAIREQTGNLIYRLTTHHSQVGSPNSGKPITELKGGIGPFLQEFITTMDSNALRIRDILGISEGVDATTPAPDTSATASKIMAGATNNVLYSNLYKGYKFLKEAVAKNIALRLQIVSRFGNQQYYYPSVGKNVMKLIETGSKLTMMQQGIKLRVRPTDEMRNSIRQMAFDSQKRKDSGGVGITMVDFLMVERILEYGNAKHAEMVLAYRENKAKKEAQQQDIARDERLTQMATTATKEKSDAKVLELETKGDQERETETLKSELRRDEREEAHEQKMKELRSSGSTEVVKKQIESTTSRANTESKLESEEHRAANKPKEEAPAS